MEAEKHKNTLQWYKQNLLESLKTWLKGAKQPLESGGLGGKSALLDMKNFELADKPERQNGAKCRLFA